MRKILLLIFTVFLYTCISAQSISGIVNRYYKVEKVHRDSGWAKLSLMDGILPSYKIAVLIQMKGVTGNTTSNTSAFGDITAVNNAGNFEFVNLCGFIGDTVFFERKLNNFYTDGELIQLVAVPQYTNVTVTDTLKAKDWDDSQGLGGILAIDVQDTLFLNKPLYATGAGFRGGGLETFPDCVFIFIAITDYFMPFSTVSNTQGARKGEGVLPYAINKECGRGKQANGGGGGNNHNGGGGGGANYGTGGLGGSRTTGSGNCRSVNGKGEGGLALKSIYDTCSTKAFLGGGGGAGHGNQNGAFGNTGKPGGNGGGIILIKAGVIKSNGAAEIIADGARPYNTNTLAVYANVHDADSDGGGGGGGAGVVLLNCNNYVGNTSISAKGAKGSNAGMGNSTGFCDAPGGGGGSGLIVLSTGSAPAGITTNVSAGASGLVINVNSPACYNTGNGATDGTAGNVLFNYAAPAPRDSTLLCKSILPVSLLLSFDGQVINDKILFTAKLTDANNVHELSLQRSFDGSNFNEVVNAGNNNNSAYYFQDIFQYRIVFYRLLVVTRDGRKYVSPVLKFSGRPSATTTFAAIYPNPVLSKPSFFFNTARAQKVQLELYDAAGKLLLANGFFIAAGENYYTLSSATEFADGLYYVKFVGENFSTARQFVKIH